ncbi:unnamed protein product [Thlaspi arvense]|uniref:Cytochrome P450 n=1 Tax=Thlaspi arvense TaxID=13288 RepID=A0AAU9SU08_THLAR|nr:unnamed protein product [Thlaspi arvense]
MAAMITVDVQYFIILILLCFFKFALVCFSLFFRKPTYGVNLPPSPPALPIIGHLHLLLYYLPQKYSILYLTLILHKFVHTLSSKYGPLLYLRVFNFPVILLSSAPLAYEIFRIHDVNISSRNIPTSEWSLLFGTSGFVTAPYGEYYKFMKKLILTKMFGPQAQEQTRSIRANELHRFYGNLLDKARKKEGVEITKEAKKLVVNTICKMSMGRTFTEENGEAESVRRMVTKSEGSEKMMFLAVLFLKLLEMLGISIFKRDISGVSQKFDKMLERILVEHEKKPNTDECMDMMDVLLAVYKDEKAEYKITRNHIKAFFVELFFGGFDTSTNTIQWTMAEIIDNPIINARLREEIDSVVGNSRLIQETDLPNLPYLQAVIKEALRLHPPAAFIPREFQEGCKIGGFFVPEKTNLIVNLYSVMRDPNFWEDPLEFKPERFLTSSRSEQEEERKEQAMKYLPFGGGRRGCPASKLTYMVVGTTIGMMVQCFDWRSKGEKVNMDEWFEGFNLTMAHPPTLTPVNYTWWYRIGGLRETMGRATWFEAGGTKRGEWT